MTKKELEEELETLKVDYQFLENVISRTGERIYENINLINLHLKKEKNKEKRKLLEGLLNEFTIIQNILNPEELAF